PFGDEPRVWKGRRGGTDEFLGRGISVLQSPWSSGQGGRPLDKCLVQRHADTVGRKSPAAVSEAVNSSPVITPRKKEFSSPVHGAPVDRGGHIRVRRFHRASGYLRQPRRPQPRRPQRMVSATASMSHRPDLRNGRGIGWACPFASI